MDDKEKSGDIFGVLKNHIDRVNIICEKLANITSIRGISKLLKKCQSEKKFLLGLQNKSAECLENHVRSGNLLHLEGIANAAVELANVTHVLEAFSCSDILHSVIVDIVCDNEDRWVKVIARNPQALHLVWAGCSNSGEKSIVHHAKQFLTCAKQHPHNFKIPSVHMIFIQGITSSLKIALENLGITCEGELHALPYDVEQSLKMLESSDSEDDILSDDDSDIENDLFSSQNIDIDKVNLDITTLICLVSNISFGHHNYVFQDDIINQQAQQERKSHLHPKLEKFISGKDIYVCETALSSFKQILDIVGGSEEQDRAKDLLDRVKIIPDNPSERSLSLKETCQIKQRAKTIFGTGDTLKAVTLTANSGFVRAAKNQGVQFSVFLHESRALTEQKQKTASFIT